MLGQTVGKYRIVSRLGRGGMGTVYKAVDETLDREVAIKSLNPDLTDPDILKRFRAEALTLARLNHPNIAMLFELTEHDGALLMVMEFLRGETFEVLSQQSGPMPVDRSRDLCMQVLDALGHAHRAGIVHRDLKPANLMLTDSGVVKVMDFGLARMAGTEHLTTDGFMVGTPAYMAPEQVLAHEIDGRADLYAMGVVLFRLLTAQLPFKAESGISMAHKQVHDAPTPVRQVRTELPPACEDIIGRALSKSPAHRFQTAEEFKAALIAMSVTGSSSAIAVPVSGLRPVSVSMPAPIPDQPTVVLQGRVRRRLPVAAVIGGITIAGLLAAGYLAWRARTGTAPQAAPPAQAPGPPPASVAAQAASSSTPSPAPVTPASASVLAVPTKAAAKKPLAEPAPVPSSEPPIPATVSFAQLKLLVLDSDKPRDRDVSVSFGADSLDVMDGGTLVERAPYHEVIGLFQSHSREPRWTKPDGTVVPLAKVGGWFSFLKGAHDWVTVQTRSGFIPLHVPDGTLAHLVSELETRTDARVVRTR
jgi:eukaryotic-like serine/threonine-protein kinase